MTANWTYKNKNKALLLLVVFLVLVAYQLSFKKTIKLIQLSYIQEQQLLLKQESPEKIKQMKAQLLMLDGHISYANKQEDLLAIITEIGQRFKLNISDIPKQLVQQKGEYLLLIDKITIEGSFSNTLKLIEELEEKQQGRIASLFFKKVKNKKTKRIQLLTTICIQNIKKNEK
jgi:hypothetical protein